MDNARALTENLASLLRREHAALGELLVALADFDRRRLWEQLGHASLFAFLHRELHLSKGAPTRARSRPSSSRRSLPSSRRSGPASSA